MDPESNSPAEISRGLDDVDVARLAPWQQWIVQRQDLVGRFVPLAVVIGFITAGIVLWATGQFEIDRVGYAGVWFFSFIGAASIFVPVPGLAAVCIAAAPAVGLHPAIIGVVAGSAEALGEMTGYLAGMSGKNILERSRLYPRFRALLLRRGGLILFFGSVIPNPLFDIMGIAAGSILYPVRKFLLYVFMAKSIKSTGIAYACYWGITWIESLLR
jgi:membrane protein YqaA with SNARE-associated domain